jgi:hypothetical protein
MEDETTEEAPVKKKRPPFEGFRKIDKAAKGFYSMPNEWTDIMADIDNLAELKVIEYIIRHTWGFHEYDQFKYITVDEFMYGRISKGERMDKGTGLKSDRSVKDGIKAAIEHGYVLCDVDSSDKARIKKSYKLKMRQVAATPLEGSSYPSGTQNLPDDQVEATTRSEKETSERNFKKNTKERKNGKSSKSTTPETSFSQSSSIIFSQEEELVYELAKKLKLSFLSKNEKNKKHCAKLVSKGVTTLEQMESLMQFCQ